MRKYEEPQMEIIEIEDVISNMLPEGASTEEF